ENTVSISITGDQMIKTMDKNPMGWMSFSAAQMGGPNAYNSLLFGEDKPVEVTYKPDTKPQFDYNKEVAEAKKYYVAFRKNSGIEKYDSLEAVKEAEREEKAQREHGKLVVAASDSANGKIYFKKLSIDQYYGTLSFTGTFSRGVHGGYYGYATITQATSETGANVLDGIQTHDSISAFISPETYSFTDTASSMNKVSFTATASFPEDCEIVSLEGRLVIDAS